MSLPDASKTSPTATQQWSSDSSLQGILSNEKAALSVPHLSARSLLLGILSHLDGNVSMDIFHFSQHGWHQGGFPRAHSAHHSHQLAWHNVQVHAERECIWKRWGELFQSNSSYFSDSMGRLENLSWIYKTPKCFFNDPLCVCVRAPNAGFDRKIYLTTNLVPLNKTLVGAWRPEFKFQLYHCWAVWSWTVTASGLSFLN